MVHVKKCPIGKRGEPTTEFHTKDGRAQVYCYGYIDMRTDEAIEECRNCKDWAYGEQCIKDFEEHIMQKGKNDG